MWLRFISEYFIIHATAAADSKCTMKLKSVHMCNAHDNHLSNCKLDFPQPMLVFLEMIWNCVKLKQFWDICQWSVTSIELINRETFHRPSKWQLDQESIPMWKKFISMIICQRNLTIAVFVSMVEAMLLPFFILNKYEDSHMCQTLELLITIILIFFPSTLVSRSQSCTFGYKQNHSIIAHICQAQTTIDREHLNQMKINWYNANIHFPSGVRFSWRFYSSSHTQTHIQRSSSYSNQFVWCAAITWSSENESQSVAEINLKKWNLRDIKY